MSTLLKALSFLVIATNAFAPAAVLAEETTPDQIGQPQQKEPDANVTKEKNDKAPSIPDAPAVAKEDDVQKGAPRQQ